MPIPYSIWIGQVWLIPCPGYRLAAETASGRQRFNLTQHDYWQGPFHPSHHFCSPYAPRRYEGGRLRPTFYTTRKPKAVYYPFVLRTALVCVPLARTLLQIVATYGAERSTWLEPLHGAPPHDAHLQTVCAVTSRHSKSAGVYIVRRHCPPLPFTKTPHPFPITSLAPPIRVCVDGSPRCCTSMDENDKPEPRRILGSFLLHLLRAPRSGYFLTKVLLKTPLFTTCSALLGATSCRASFDWSPIYVVSNAIPAPSSQLKDLKRVDFDHLGQSPHPDSCSRTALLLNMLKGTILPTPTSSTDPEVRRGKSESA